METSRTLAFILILLLFLVSCSDDDRPTAPRDGDVAVEFPGAVGMLWKYQVYDSLSETTDTVWWSITEMHTADADIFTAERREWRFPNNRFGWQYLSVKGDTLELLDDTVGVSANERFVFPFELGNFWTGPAGVGDTSTVTLVGEIDVPVARFTDGARIDRSWNLDFEGGGNWSQTWIVPDVGMVYRYVRSQYSDGQSITVTTNEVWKLMEYELTTFELNRFPLTIGSWWEYDYHFQTLDSTFDDIVTVTVVQDIPLPGGEVATLWEYVWDSMDRVDSIYVAAVDSYVRMQHAPEFIHLWDVYYQFPMAVGRHWGMDYLIPVPTVTDKGPVSVPAGEFPCAFQQSANGGAFNSYWRRTDWLVPGVGIVASDVREIEMSPEIRTTWRLRDYEIQSGT